MGTQAVEPVRIKVACINWSYANAPHAVVYLTGGRYGRHLHIGYFPDQAEAMTHADLVAARLRAMGGPA